MDFVKNILYHISLCRQDILEWQDILLWLERVFRTGILKIPVPVPVLKKIPVLPVPVPVLPATLDTTQLTDSIIPDHRIVP